jgi:hypothetical protein
VIQIAATLAAIWLFAGLMIALVCIRDGATGFKLRHWLMVVVAGPPVLVGLIVFGILNPENPHAHNQPPGVS